ncbi:MAG: hypothetical protein KatS3mg111_1439 [Pirellulaceae bacterium]|nr:MAG: hypothetical protein KatS3mg111_1439 [Pirellulaceae bacterium]
MRYESGYPITGSLTAGNGAFYVGNTEGTLAKFTADDRFGQIEWEYRTGHTITAPALVVGDRVFVVNESGEIDAIEDATGEAAWEIEGLEVKRALAVSGNLLFSVSIANELIAQEVTSGSQMGRTIPLPLAEPIINPISDRVYLVMEDGKLECLRPVGASLPTLVAPPQTTEPDEEQAPASSPPSTPKSSANPFDTPSGGTNPFDTAPAGGNPFGGGDGNAADPFGGGAGGADPFGNDPFGGGN